MPMMPEPSPCAESPGIPLLAAADLQDDLMVATNDLQRLQRLLDDASDSLLGHFYGASGELKNLLHVAARHPDIDAKQLHQAMEHMAGAITAMQFQDMATQLVEHTTRRLRNCADRLALEAMGDDEDGTTVVEAAPLRPNPVTQDEMDAGSIELF
jgi:exopolyphosphatase/pppGpp-phosphohydrolase